MILKSCMHLRQDHAHNQATTGRGSRSEPPISREGVQCRGIGGVRQAARCPFPACRLADPVYVFAVRGEVEKAASDKYDSEMLEPCTDATVVVEEVHMAPVNLNDPKCSAGKFRMAHQSRVAERPQNFRRPTALSDSIDRAGCPIPNSR
jgi:hypothetical protein